MANKPVPHLSPNNLIDEETGETNLAVLKALSRRRAMADFGALSPRYLRQSLRYYGGMIPQMQAAWRQRQGLPIDAVMVAPYGKQSDGVRRSAF
jgi:hypothetical protein